MNMSDIMLEAFRQEWENLPTKTQRYYIERFREIAGDEPSQEQEPVAWVSDTTIENVAYWRKKTPDEIGRAHV